MDVRKESTTDLQYKFNSKTLLLVTMGFAAMLTTIELLSDQIERWIDLAIFYCFLIVPLVFSSLWVIVIRLCTQSLRGWSSLWLAAVIAGIVGVGVLWFVLWLMTPDAGDFRHPSTLIYTTVGFGLTGGTLAASVFRVLLLRRPVAESSSHHPSPTA